MLDLVLWSCFLALMPWALGLAGKLISGVAGLISPAIAERHRSPFPAGRRAPEIVLRPVAVTGFGNENSHAIR